MNYIKLSFDMAKNDLKIKYSRTIIGWLWMFIYPLSLLAIYTVIFSGILDLSWVNTKTNETIGYVYPFSIGLFVYLFTAEILIGATDLFVNKKNHIKRSSYPLWSIYLSLVFRSFINFIAFFIIILVVGIYLNYVTTFNIIFTIVVALFGVIVISIIGLIFAMLGPFLRDINEMMRLVVRVLFYASPISYPLNIVPEKFQSILIYNPITIIIESMRSYLVFDQHVSISSLLPFFVTTGVCSFIAVWLYIKLEESIADVV